jgi:hypothetical protein
MAFGLLAQLPHCSANSLQFPAHAKISLLGWKKFPVPMRREFHHNWSGLLLNLTGPAAKKMKIAKFLAEFPARREFAGRTATALAAPIQSDRKPL